MFDIIDAIKKINKKTFSIINPLETQQLFENLYCVKDGDSNYFIYKKGDKVIAIDIGYKDSKTRDCEIKKIPINLKEINSIFLTHIDSDHAGCLYEDDSIVKDSDVYLNEKEIAHLNKSKERVKLGFIKINHKLEVKRVVTFFNNNNPIYIGDIKIQPILTSGHTLGHTSFCVDNKYLFTGDSLILKNGYGYRFFDLLSFNNKENSKSLLKLKEFAITNGCEYIITSHTGLTNDIESAFKFCNKKYS